jgi:hypothetical protein
MYVESVIISFQMYYGLSDKYDVIGKIFIKKDCSSYFLNFQFFASFSAFFG